MQEQPVSKQLDENITWWKQQFSDCADIKMRPMCLGRDMSIRAFLSYIEVTGGKNMMEDSVLGKNAEPAECHGTAAGVCSTAGKRTGSFGCHTFCTDVGSGRRDADR